MKCTKESPSQGITGNSLWRRDFSGLRRLDSNIVRKLYTCDWVRNKSWNPNTQYSVYRQQNAIVNTELAKSLDLNFPQHYKKYIIYDAKATMATVLQYKCIKLMGHMPEAYPMSSGKHISIF